MFVLGQLTKLLISLVLLVAFKLSLTGQLGPKEHVHGISNVEEHVRAMYGLTI